MNRFVSGLIFVGACLPLGLRGAEEAPSKSVVSEAIKIRAAEDAKQGKAKSVLPAKSPAAAEVAREEAAATVAAASAATPAPAAPVSPADAAKVQKEAPTVLDPVEVRKRKLSEFEDQLRKQEAEIIREKKNTKPTELDKALNGSAASKALAIFGGKSNEQRANVASERVSMMEDEKDLIEAIHQAKTKEEKKELQKQLDELKAMRRELEKSTK